MTHTCNRPTRLKQSSCLKLSTSRENTQWVSAETNQKELELAYNWECYYTPVFSSIRHAYESLAVVFGCFGVVLRACVFMCLHVHLKARWYQVTSSAFFSHWPRAHWFSLAGQRAPEIPFPTMPALGLQMLAPTLCLYVADVLDTHMQVLMVAQSTLLTEPSSKPHLCIKGN